MTTVKSLVASIALLSSLAVGSSASASNVAECNALTGEALGVGLAVNHSASAASVGQCNALTGRALGLVHRIDQGETELCANLLKLFSSFAMAGCLDLLVNEQVLFLNHALGEYQLACDVFINDCHADPRPACQFPD